MNDIEDGRKISIKNENHAFLKKVQSEGLIKDTGNGVLIGVSYALKHKLQHESLEAPRSANSYTNVDDGKSFNAMNEVKIILESLYIEKYNDKEMVKSPTKLIRVLADAGLDSIREKCNDNNVSFTEKFLETIEI